MSVNLYLSLIEIGQQKKQNIKSFLFKQRKESYLCTVLTLILYVVGLWLL